MRKPFVIAMLALLVCGGLVIFFVWRHNAAPSSLIVTEKDIAEAAKKLGRSAPPPQIAAVPLDLKRPVRLAIGSLGFVDENQNRRISDLVLAELSGAQGLNLVERQALDAALREMSMSLSGLVRAKDAVRVGKLLKADWFLLGTEAKFGGTNFVVVRVVDARTGILRDAGVFPDNQSPTQLATDIGTFVRQSRQNAASAKARTYLAIGTFQDLSVNNRQAAFPSQLRSYLTAAYQGTETTLLEREAVDTLLQEVRLDLAGLTESGGTNAAQPMQSAYWLVDGSYQSYETTNFQVELVLEMTRMFGRRELKSFRGEPGASLFQQVKSAIDSEMNRNATALWPTRNSEARVQMQNGKELANLNGPTEVLVLIPKYVGAPVESRRNLEEAIRGFQAVLLLEPTNREAKLCLAMCLRKPAIQRVDEARDYYREILEESVTDKWTFVARDALVSSFSEYDTQEKAGWFASALRGNTNSPAAEFYRQQAAAVARRMEYHNAEGTNAEQLVRERLIQDLHAFHNMLSGKNGYSSDEMGMGLYSRKVYGTNREAAAQALVALLPEMTRHVPDLRPYLLATVVTFQTKANAPIISEFERVLGDTIQHPDQIFKVQQFWNHVRWTVYRWCFEKTNYALAVKLMEGERLVGEKGNVDFNDQEKIKLAYAYVAAQRWQDALNVFESFSGKAVSAEGDGPWGRYNEPVFTDKLTALCREKLGAKVAGDQREFELATNLFAMRPSGAYQMDADGGWRWLEGKFQADTDGLWVVVEGQLIRLDFDFKTNFIAKLPVHSSTLITCMAVGPEKIWIGTRGAGLIQFDKGSRSSRQITEADGLVMNDISALDSADNQLWIGYGRGTRGGFSALDLRSQKIKSYTASLTPLQADGAEVPPSSTVEAVLADRIGDVWVVAARENLRRLHTRNDQWESPPDRGGGRTTCITLNDRCLVECVSVSLRQNEIDLLTSTNGSWPKDPNLSQKTTLVLSDEELARLRVTLQTNKNQRISRHKPSILPPKAVLHILGLREGRWQSLENVEAVPHPATAMALDGHNLWIGGEGFISLLDLEQNKLLKTTHLQTRSIDRLQIAGGYLWAQFDGHLHRASLADLR